MGFFGSKNKQVSTEDTEYEISDDEESFDVSDVTQKVSESEIANYSNYYDRNTAYRLLKKLRKATRNKPKVVAGPSAAIVTTLGKLLSALDNPATPTHLKALIVGAIGYIVLPIDLIPDMMPVVGYGDDLASAAGIVAAVAAYSNFSLEDLDREIDAGII